VLWLVQTHLSSTGNRESRDESPPLIRNRRHELHAFRAKPPDAVVDVMAHQKELMVRRIDTAVR
jgi:hypothetical protein